MVASVASYGNLNLIQARTVSPGVVMPSSALPISRDHSRPEAQHAVSAVALAPAAMAALIEAQEHESAGAAPLARLRTVHVLDKLIATLDGSEAAMGSPVSTQRLEAARQRLSEMTTTA